MDWRAYTYIWRDDQTDADLAPAEGAEKEVRIGKQQRVWQFHSRSQCMSCHSNQSEYALAFLPEQLNRAGAERAKSAHRLHARRGSFAGPRTMAQPLPPFDAASAGREREDRRPD